MSERKAIQISTTNVENTQSTQCNFIVVALCNDNSVWVLRNTDDKWFELPKIPEA